MNFSKVAEHAAFEAPQDENHARGLVRGVAVIFAAPAEAADFGSKGGPEPANIDEIAGFLRQDPYDMESLISVGTSKEGSAGHLALAIRDQVHGMTGSTRPTSTPTGSASTKNASMPMT